MADWKDDELMNQQARIMELEAWNEFLFSKLKIAEKESNEAEAYNEVLINQLKAHCEVQKKALLDAVQLLPGGDIKASVRDAYDSTPWQSLLVIQAKAIEYAAEFTKEKMIYSIDVPYMCDPRNLEVYANQLRAQAKEGIK